MKKKEIVKQVIQVFLNADNEKALSYMTNANRIERGASSPCGEYLILRADRWSVFLAVVCASILAFFTGVDLAQAQASTPSYASRAPLEHYQMVSQTDEVALALSAAPASISDDAEVLTLGKNGYEIAVEGENGFVCIVERSWSTDFNSAEFWNPKVRAPTCYNPAAARSVLQTYLTRTEWVLADISREEMLNRTKAAITANTITQPEPGAMCYMMSKQGYLSDENPEGWKPHLMFFLPSTQPSEWGANLPGVPVYAAPDGLKPLTTVFLSVLPFWSDGTPTP